MPTVKLTRSDVNKELAAYWDNEEKCTAAEWNVFRDEDYLSANDIAHRIVERRQRKGFMPEETPTVGLPDELVLFIEALSVMTADAANSDPAVIGFRGRNGLDPLLDTDDIERWVKQQAKRDGPATKQVTFTVPNDWKPGDPIDTTQRPATATTLLPYRSEGTWKGNQLVGGHIAHQPVDSSGVLGELHTLSGMLAKAHRWTQEQAVMFVLSGVTPIVSLFEVNAVEQRYSTHSGGQPANTRQRIVLTVDPDIPVEHVAEIYKQTRRQFRGTRNRLPELQRLRLALHAAANADVSTRSQMNSWNRLHPDDEIVNTNYWRQAVRRVSSRIGAPVRPDIVLEHADGTVSFIEVKTSPTPKRTATVRGNPPNKRICSVKGCGRKHWAKALCAMHYQRARKHTCSEDESSRPQKAKSLCDTHSQWARKETAR